MPEPLFVFIQMEFAWALGPPDGRYLLRDGADGEPERVIVLATISAERSAPGSTAPSARRHGLRLLSRRRRRGLGATATADPAPVPTARATIVDPISLSAEHQARAWLSEGGRPLLINRFVGGGSVTLATFDWAQEPDFWGGGHFLYSTPRDYLRFQRMLLGGGALDGVQILEGSTVDDAFRNHIGDLNWPPSQPRCRRSRTRVRENETNGARLLLEQVRDEPGGSREYRYSLERAQRIPGIEKNGWNRTRNISRCCCLRECPRMRSGPHAGAGPGGSSGSCGRRPAADPARGRRPQWATPGL